MRQHDALVTLSYERSSFSGKLAWENCKMCTRMYACMYDSFKLFYEQNK